MTGRWQREGVHAGTPADPVVKHLDGVPWYAASAPWILHHCRAQTIALWWERKADGWLSQFPAGGTSYCACGATADLNTDTGWRGRNERRSACTKPDLETTVEFGLTLPHQRIESPVVPSVQSALRVMAGR
jgi:hypothetical protein